MRLPVVTNCDGCGACCRHMGTPPFIVAWHDGTPKAFGNDSGFSADDLGWLLAAPEESRDVIRAAHNDEGREDESPCVWLDPETQRCRWHEFRPGICRDFDVGGEDCLATRKKYQIANP